MSGYFYTVTHVCSGLSLSEKDWALDLACHQQSARPALGQYVEHYWISLTHRATLELNTSQYQCLIV